MDITTRNLTKFLVPMVDVMTLLFSVFLLMPIVEEKQKEEKYAGSDPESIHKEEMRSVEQELQRRMVELEDLRPYKKTALEYERLKKEVAELKEKTAREIEQDFYPVYIKVNEKGALSHTDTLGKTILLDNPNKVKRFITEQRKQSQKETPQKKLIIHFVGPEIGKTAPFDPDQRVLINKWFSEVATFNK